MAEKPASLISEALWKTLAPLLPERRRSRKGGRLRVDDRAVLNGIQRRIPARIARRGIESSERPGRHRWVVERRTSCL
ncbi:hypothetical protein C6P92_26375 [Burkholderia multivorans]|nr:hypothetical protein C6P92_26375 [Burkholderia multivorans]